MPTSQSCPAQEGEDKELVDELVPDDDSHEYIRRGNPKTSLPKQPVRNISSRTFPRTLYCRTCQRARMMAPHACRKGGQSA